MRKLFTVVLALLINASLFGGSGIFQTYGIFNIDAGGNTYLAGGDNPDSNPTFVSASFGTPSSLILNGGEVKTFKNGGSDVFGASINYRVYEQGETPGGFTELNLGFGADLGGGDQRWITDNANIDLLAMATGNGTWVIELFWKASTSDGDDFDSNGGANYTNTFMVTVLPVELTTFSATPEARKIALTWTTSSEENNAGFEIQKSNNGKDFETVGFVEGNGTSVEVNTYNFIDESPVSGENYYRLKQNDFDGNFEYSDILTVKFDAKTTATIYPNPTTDKLVVATELQEEVNIRIFNMNGQVVYQNSKRVDNQLEINLEELAKGNYILQVSNATNQAMIYNGTFVKQ